MLLVLNTTCYPDNLFEQQQVHVYNCVHEGEAHASMLFVNVRRVDVVKRRICEARNSHMCAWCLRSKLLWTRDDIWFCFLIPHRTR